MTWTLARLSACTFTACRLQALRMRLGLTAFYDVNRRSKMEFSSACNESGERTADSLAKETTGEVVGMVSSVNGSRTVHWSPRPGSNMVFA